jgi:hypothetical protein
MAGHWDREERQGLRRDEGRQQEIARAVQHRQPIGKDKRVIDGAGPLLPHFRERRFEGNRLDAGEVACSAGCDFITGNV